MRHNFPYTNFHDLNLDWILAKVNEWDALIKQKLIEISKAVTTANTASASVAVAVEQAAQANLNAETAKNTANDALTTANTASASVAVAVEQAAQANLNAETAKNTANDALTTAREGATAAANSAAAAAENSGLCVTKAEAAEASATAAANSAAAAAENSGLCVTKAEAAEASATAAAASAKAAEEAAANAGGGGSGGGYVINNNETLTGIKYLTKDVYVKLIYLGYHLDVDLDIFRIPYTGVEAFLKIDILREEVYSEFTGLQPTNIVPSGYANGNFTIDIAEGVAEGSYYAIIYYTKA